MFHNNYILPRYLKQFSEEKHNGAFLYEMSVDELRSQ